MQDALDQTVNPGSALEVLFAALKYRIVPEPGHLQERRERFSDPGDALAAQHVLALQDPA